MPRPSKASRHARALQANLKARRTEREAERVRRIQKRAADLKAALAFNTRHLRALQLQDPSAQVEATRLFLETVADSDDLLLSEIYGPVAEALCGTVYALEEHPGAFFSLKHTAFNAFVLVENLPMKRLSLAAKDAAIQRLWARLEQEVVQPLFDALDDKHPDCFFMHIGTDASLATTMVPVSLFFDAPDDALPDALAEQDAAVLEKRRRKAEQWAAWDAEEAAANQRQEDEDARWEQRVRELSRGEDVY